MNLPPQSCQIISSKRIRIKPINTAKLPRSVAEELSPPHRIKSVLITGSKLLIMLVSKPMPVLDIREQRVPQLIRLPVKDARNALEHARRTRIILPQIAAELRAIFQNKAPADRLNKRDRGVQGHKLEEVRVYDPLTSDLQAFNVRLEALSVPLEDLLHVRAAQEVHKNLVQEEVHAVPRVDVAERIWVGLETGIILPDTVASFLRDAA